MLIFYVERCDVCGTRSTSACFSPTSSQTWPGYSPPCSRYSTCRYESTSSQTWPGYSPPSSKYSTRYKDIEYIFTKLAWILPAPGTVHVIMIICSACLLRYTYVYLYFYRKEIWYKFVCLHPALGGPFECPLPPRGGEWICKLECMHRIRDQTLVSI